MMHVSVYLSGFRGAQLPEKECPGGNSMFIQGLDKSRFRGYAIE